MLLILLGAALFVSFPFIVKWDKERWRYERERCENLRKDGPYHYK